MRLLSVEELSRELAVPSDYLRELIDKNIIIPFGGRARLGEPKFSPRSLSVIRSKLAETTQYGHGG